MSDRRAAYLTALLCASIALPATIARAAEGHQPGSGRLERVPRGRLSYVHATIGVKLLLPRGFVVEAHEKHSADVELHGPGGCTVKLQRLLPETEAVFASWPAWAAARRQREPGARDLVVADRPALQWRRADLLTTLVGVTAPADSAGPASGHVDEIQGWWTEPRQAAACGRAYDEVLRSLSVL